MYTLVLEVQDDSVYGKTLLFDEPYALNIDNAGFDLYAAEDASKEPFQYLSLGVTAVLLDEKTDQPCHFWLLPRSSFSKTGYVMANSVGVIDKSYRGTLKAPIRFLHEADGIKKGQRYFQIVAPDMLPISQVVYTKQSLAELYPTDRGTGGFGSTGLH